MSIKYKNLNSKKMEKVNKFTEFVLVEMKNSVRFKTFLLFNLLFRIYFAKIILKIEK